MKPRTLPAGPRPPPPGRCRVPRPSTAAQAVKARCGGPVHALLDPPDGADKEQHELFYAGLKSTSAALVYGPVFGPGGTGLAQLTDEDVFVELGCGLGGVLLAACAAAPQCRCVGVEIDEANVAAARKAVTNVCASGDMEAKATFDRNCGHEVVPCVPGLEVAQKCLLAVATVVYMYLGEWANLRLRSRLVRTLRPGTRVICRGFTMGTAWPVHSEAKGTDGVTTFRLYMVTASCKDDEALLADAELNRLYGGLRWLQPPPGAFHAGASCGLGGGFGGGGSDAEEQKEVKDCQVAVSGTVR